MSNRELWITMGSTHHLMYADGRSLCGALRLVTIIGYPLAKRQEWLDSKAMCRRCKRVYERRKREAAEVAPHEWHQAD